MHADLAKLLDLQSKDTAVAAAERRVDEVRRELAALDAALQHARTTLEAARQAASETARRRDEWEAKVEKARATHQKRQQRLDQVRNPKEASAATAEVELAAAVVAKEEAEWVRSAELLEQQERRIRELEEGLAAAEAAQQPERERLEAQLRELDRERQAAVEAREASADRVDRALRIRYDRLRRSRQTEVVVPLVGSTCGACFTSVPLNRRTQIRNGQAIEGCEACGAILYSPDAG